MGERGPERVLDVIAGDRVVADRLAGELVKRALAFDQKRQRDV